MEGIMTYIVPQYHGPICIPFKNMHGRYEGHPNNPAMYGRYIVIDLTANNRPSCDAWHERNPDEPYPDLGFGVCRHGFGLQNLGWLTEEEAIAQAARLNENIIIGTLELRET